MSIGVTRNILIKEIIKGCCVKKELNKMTLRAKLMQKGLPDINFDIQAAAKSLWSTFSSFELFNNHKMVEFLY